MSLFTVGLHPDAYREDENGAVTDLSADTATVVDGDLVFNRAHSKLGQATHECARFQAGMWAYYYDQGEDD